MRWWPVPSRRKKGRRGPRLDDVCADCHHEFRYHVVMRTRSGSCYYMVDLASGGGMHISGSCDCKRFVVEAKACVV